MKTNHSIGAKVLSCSAAFLMIFTSCSKEETEKVNPSPSTATSRDRGARLSNGTGTDHGFFYTLYTSGGTSDLTFPNANTYAGNFQIDYTNVGDVVGGKGWKPGSSRTINYNVGSISGSYNFVGVYGWTKSPLIEYYVVEKGNIPYAGGSGADAGRVVNTISADGHTYTFAKHKQINQPNITGVNGDFWQYIDNWGGQSFNGSKSINMTTHINNWKSKGGQGFGSYDYQVFGLEAFGNKSGSINATVW
ncbi:glycoside hydrolase family 11 protein [Lacihabitans lacunae]|jgi:endo-1,4-beta-xylanase|uniref:endo-1,4-beta-xylanase n=1 Tax=Lacihabitans lacunae TaxID=1028214 RepID=A0ABV7YX92_9BACT